MGKLTNKVALITGGASGIGYSTTKLFIEEGAKVVITGRNIDKLNAVSEEFGANILAIQTDVNDPQGLEQATTAAVQQFGRLDIVFANAGISGSTPLGSTTLETFNQVLQTNVTGAFLTVQAALPHLKAGASVILVGSVIAKSGRVGSAAYAASKGAITSMARVITSELSPLGVRVNTVVPGPIRTPIWGYQNVEELDQLERSIAMSVPLQRMGEPEEIARTVLFLASDDSSYVQGAEISVDGGSGSSPMGAPVYLQN